MSDSSEPQPRSFLLRVFVYVMKALMPLLVLLAAAAMFMWMRETSPQAERTQRVRLARLVEVTLAERGPQQVVLRSQGTVRAAREVEVRPQVTGEVIEVGEKLEPGSLLREGDLVLRIEPRDFELVVQSTRSALERAQAELTVEVGNQRVAEREYELLDRDLSEEERALVLRRPQLAMARADVERAQADLEDALLDLERTEIRAPFDALVVTEEVDPGTRITTTTQAVARLIGADRFWLELSVPQSDLRWLDLPAEGAAGSPVVLRQPSVWAPGDVREGRVLRLLSGLSAEGRMARLLIEVTDPLTLEPGNAGKPRLLIGQYLLAEIRGKDIPDAVEIDRELLRAGDTVWLANADNELEIVPVDVAYRGLEHVIVTDGIPDGARIVTTNMATVTHGMPLRLSEPAPAGAAAETADAGPPAERQP